MCRISTVYYLIISLFLRSSRHMRWNCQLKFKYKQDAALEYWLQEVQARRVSICVAGASRQRKQCVCVSETNCSAVSLKMRCCLHKVFFVKDVKPIFIGRLLPAVAVHDVLSQKEV